MFFFFRHTDGSVRFWDASAGSLQVLYKLKTAKVFEKARAKSPEGGDDDPFAVQLLSFCPESRKLAVAGISSYVVLFKFRKLESTFETTVIYRLLAFFPSSFFFFSYSFRQTTILDFRGFRVLHTQQ